MAGSRRRAAAGGCDQLERGWAAGARAARYRAGVSMPRGTLAGLLAALGFADTARAQALLTGDLGLD